MGNNNSSPNKQQSAISTQARLILHLRSRTVIVHHSYKMKLQLSDVALFPHGLDGLKLWESDIVASRYIVINNPLFEGKEVLTINSGVGICGISMKKWTQASNVVMGQFHEEVVQNIKRNCQKNQVKEITAFRLDWKQIEKYVAKYDIVFGADIFYNGSPYKELLLLLKRFLKIGGQGVFVVPEKDDSRQLFFKLIQTEQQQHNAKQDSQARRSSQLEAPKDQHSEKQKGPSYDEFYFEVKKQPKLVHEEYFLSPLPNKVEGMEEFPMLNSVDFAVYRIIKKKRDAPIEKYQVTQEIKQSSEVQKKNHQRVQNQLQQRVQKVQKEAQEVQEVNLQDINTNDITQEVKDAEEQKVKAKIEELKKEVEAQQQKDLVESTQGKADQTNENAKKKNEAQQQTELTNQPSSQEKTQNTQQCYQKDIPSGEVKTEEPRSQQQAHQLNCQKVNQPKQQKVQDQTYQEKTQDIEQSYKEQKEQTKPNESSPQQEAQYNENKDEQGDQQQNTAQNDGEREQQSSQNKREQEQAHQTQTAASKKNKKKRKR